MPTHPVSLCKRLLIVLVVLVLAACSSGADESGTQSEPGGDGAAAGGELSDDTLVPPIRFLGATAAYEEALFESNNLMIENWEELGLTVEQELLAEVTAVLETAAERNYDVVSFGYAGRVERIDPNDLLSGPFLCEYAETGTNYSDWCYEEYDEVVQASKAAVDEEERRELVLRAQEILALDIPWVTVYHPSEVYAYNSEAYGNVVEAFALGPNNYYNVIEAEPLGNDKVYRMGSDAAFRSMNPMVAESYQIDVEMQRLVFDTLTKIQPDGSVGAHLATEWEFSDDTTLVASLTPDATFHDGEPVTAEDVKFSFDYIKEWEVGLYVDQLSEIESVEVVDDHTVQFNLAAPSVTVLPGALSNVPILPEHIWSTIVEDEGLEHPAEWTETNLVGSGPFTVTNVAVGEAVELARNDDFWGTLPKSESVLTVFYADSQSVFRALQDGTIYFHQVGALAPEAVEQVQSGQFSHLTTGEVGSTAARGVTFRVAGDSPFQDYPLRLAMAHAIDKSFAVDVGLRGFGVPGAGIIAPANEAWHNADIPQEELDHDTPHWHQLDLELARQILEEAGYRWDDQGRLHYPQDHQPRPHFDSEAAGEQPT